MRFLGIIFMVTSMMLVSCKNNDNVKTTRSSDQSVAVTTKYTLTPFAPSTEYASAAINAMEYKDGVFSFKLNDSDYSLQAQTPDAGSKLCANSGKGQHIHLIVDTLPYAAKYTDSFEHEVADGRHGVLAFLSRSYHESIKNATAHKAVWATVKDKNIVQSEPIHESGLFYSRPKGTYTGKKNTDRIMLDFFLVNEDLSNRKVRATINGEVHDLEKWVPYYIDGLPMGKNTVRLQLLEKDGTQVSGPLTDVTREFVLMEDPLDQ